MSESVLPIGQGRRSKAQSCWSGTVLLFFGILVDLIRRLTWFTTGGPNLSSLFPAQPIVEVSSNLQFRSLDHCDNEPELQ